ncbi:MAG: anti-phage-associated DUF3780 domain-containing protein, partial [Terricaulis sp.]
MNLHVRIPLETETVGFGAPTGIDPHCFEVHVPAGNGGEIRIIENYGVAAGAFGRPAAERAVLSRKAWLAIRDDLKRHFNERLKEKHMTAGTWKSGVNKVERLLGQELVVLCWGVEAAETSLISIGVRNWLALRPEERWWLYAVTAAATGETKHREVGWRKALRYALTENPVRESLSRAEPAALAGPRGKARPRRSEDENTPRLPGFEEESSPFVMDAPILIGVHEEIDAAAVLPERRPVADRASAASAKNLSGSAKGKKRRPKPNAD